jgi:hypothetical protein
MFKESNNPVWFNEELPVVLVDKPNLQEICNVILIRNKLTGETKTVLTKKVGQKIKKIKYLIDSRLTESYKMFHDVPRDQIEFHIAGVRRIENWDRETTAKVSFTQTPDGLLIQRKNHTVA